MLNIESYRISLIMGEKKEKQMDERSAIRLFYKKGFKTKAIVEKLADLSISRRKVDRTIKRLRETGSIANRPKSGCPRSARTRELIAEVKRRLKKNPQQSVRNLARQLHT